MEHFFMKKVIFTITFIFILAACNLDSWKESPSFESGSYKMIGDKGKLGFIYEFLLPEHLPVPIYKDELWLKTEVEIPRTLDPQDKDYVEVKMHSFMEFCMKTFQDELGFSASVREVLMDKQIIKAVKRDFASMLDARQHLIFIFLIRSPFYRISYSK